MSLHPALSETTNKQTDSDLHDPRRPDSLLARNNRQPILPLLPQHSSLLARSSSPRHHTSTTSSHSSARRTLRAGNAPALSKSPSTPTRQRQQSPSHWSSLRRTSSSIIIPPTHWGEDTITNDLVLDNIAIPLSPSSEDDGSDSDNLFLSTFADNDFSSPSTYPPFTTANLPASEAPPPDQAASQPQHTAPTNTNNPGLEAAPPRQVSAYTRAFAASSRSTTQLSSSSLGESQNTSFTTDSDEDSLPSQIPRPLFPDKMAPHSQFQPIPNDADSPSINKRLRTSQPGADAVNSASVSSLAMPSVPLEEDDDDLFGDTLTTQGSEGVDGEDLTTIDLTEVNKVPEELKKPQEDNRIKMSKFQCVICMDDVKTLTVTHCGHLYCAQCLHSSLHVEATKGRCPMCRAKIDTKSRSSYNSKTKGFWHLELKLTTASKGKRKADDLS